jgi:hypothetical protein
MPNSPLRLRKFEFQPGLPHLVFVYRFIKDLPPYSGSLPKLKGKSRFDFEPDQPIHHFTFLYLNKLPQSHALTHQYFCKNYSCPFHIAY